MKKTFISKLTALSQKVTKSYERWCTLEDQLTDLKRECDHRTPESTLTLKTVRVPKRGSQKAYTYKICTICGEDVYKDCYGRFISVWNRLEPPEEEKRRIENILAQSGQKQKEAGTM